MHNDGTNVKKLNNRLLILRDLCPDVVLGSGSSGDISIIEVTKSDWKRTIDDKITVTN